MTRFLCCAALAALALLGASVASAQGPADVPAGPARVVGQLLHDTRPDATAEVDVVLYALADDGSAGLRQTRTDTRAASPSSGISNAPGVVYLVGARPGDVPFGERFRFEAGSTEHRLTLTLSDPSSDAAAAAAVKRLDLRIDRACDELRLVHSYTVVNPTDAVIFVPEAARSGARPLFEAAIPADARGFESLLERSGLERDGTRVQFWGPLYPGNQEIPFGYGLPLDTTAWELGFPAGAPPVQILTPEGVVEAQADGFTSADPVELEGAPYEVQRAPGLDARATLRVALGLGEATQSALRTTRSEWWIEVDDASLEVNERLEVEVDDAAGLPASPGSPLFCLALPREATGLRFSNDLLEAGLRRDPGGALALHGPLPSGTRQWALSYRLPATARGGAIQRRFDRDLPLLSVLVADTGVVTETDRLHRRRSIRSGDRLYLHLEAFALEAGETLELGLRRTAPKTGGGRWAATGSPSLAGLAAFGFLAGPLRAEASVLAERDQHEDDTRELEREAIQRSLDDLDEDLETGKLTQEDHAVMRQSLRARAARLLLEREAPAAPAAPNVTACPACGAAVASDARFCSQCGTSLGVTGDA